jgi:hypothetical protein
MRVMDGKLKRKEVQVRVTRMMGAAGRCPDIAIILFFLWSELRPVDEESLREVQRLSMGE